MGNPKTAYKWQEMSTITRQMDSKHQEEKVLLVILEPNTQGTLNESYSKEEKCKR
jgi:hypothetical protein